MSSSSSLLLAPLGAVYGAVMRARVALYGAGVFESQRVGAPVVSVGNLTTGGTGKTPLVAWLAGALAQEGRRVAILTRGYGRTEARRRVVVSDGERLLADAREGGDEPRMLAEMLLNLRVSVLSDADRVAAARWALEKLKSDLFILDDGFQHLRIRRDLNILTLDALSPWGGGRMLPAGNLREPVEEVRRADTIVITRADLSPHLASLKAEVGRLSGGRAPVFTSRLRIENLRPLQSYSAGDVERQGDAEGLALDKREQSFVAFCALGNAEAFFAQLRRENFSLAATRAFADHHVYRPDEIDALIREARTRQAAALLTTAKDAVKLRSLAVEFPCFVVEASLVIEEEERLREMVRRVVSAR